MDVIRKLFLGTNPGYPLKRQSVRYAWSLVQNEWNSTEVVFGVVRLVRLFILVATFVLPTVWIDHLVGSNDRRVVGLVREGYVAFRFLAVLAFAAWLFTYDLAAYGAWYSLCDILVAALGASLVWGELSIDPRRSLIIALVNYWETVVAFAGLYRHYWPTPLSLTQAVYFSAVTATTVGYGEIYPCTITTQRLVVSQLAVSLIMIAVVIATFVTKAMDGRPQVAR